MAAPYDPGRAVRDSRLSRRLCLGLTACTVYQPVYESQKGPNREKVSKVEIANLSPLGRFPCSWARWKALEKPERSMEKSLGQHLVRFLAN